MEFTGFRFTWPKAVRVEGVEFHGDEESGEVAVDATREPGRGWRFKCHLVTDAELTETQADEATKAFVGAAEIVIALLSNRPSS